MRWGRIAIGAVLLEAVLLAIAVPLLGVINNPFVGGGGGGDFTAFFVTVAVACFAVGALCGWWVARPISANAVWHGALTGMLATAIYLAICSIPPNTVPAVVAAYGVFWFLTVNGLRIVGAMLGASYHSRRAQRAELRVEA